MATEEIGACLETTEFISSCLQGDYTILNRWYRHASASQPNPSCEDLEKVYRYYATLYQQEDQSPTERPVPTHISPFQINNGVLTEEEVVAAVRQLRVNSAAGHTHLQYKNFKMWLREVYPENEATGPPETSKMYKTCGDTPVQV